VVAVLSAPVVAYSMRTVAAPKYLILSAALTLLATGAVAQEGLYRGPCIAKIQFGKGSIAVHEESTCTYFHGAACDFSGRLMKR
jgi:hypothetical protein